MSRRRNKVGNESTSCMESSEEDSDSFDINNDHMTSSMFLRGNIKLGQEKGMKLGRNRCQQEGSSASSSTSTASASANQTESIGISLESPFDVKDNRLTSSMFERVNTKLGKDCQLKSNVPRLLPQRVGSETLRRPLAVSCAESNEISSTFDINDTRATSSMFLRVNEKIAHNRPLLPRPKRGPCLETTQNASNIASVNELETPVDWSSNTFDKVSMTRGSSRMTSSLQVVSNLEKVGSRELEINQELLLFERNASVTRELLRPREGIDTLELGGGEVSQKKSINNEVLGLSPERSTKCGDAQNEQSASWCTSSSVTEIEVRSAQETTLCDLNKVSRTRGSSRTVMPLKNIPNVGNPVSSNEPERNQDGPLVNRSELKSQESHDLHAIHPSEDVAADFTKSNLINSKATGLSAERSPDLLEGSVNCTYFNYESGSASRALKKCGIKLPPYPEKTSNSKTGRILDKNEFTTPARYEMSQGISPEAPSEIFPGIRCEAHSDKFQGPRCEAGLQMFENLLLSAPEAHSDDFLCPGSQAHPKIAVTFVKDLAGQTEFDDIHRESVSPSTVRKSRPSQENIIKNTLIECSDQESHEHVGDGCPEVVELDLDELLFASRNSPENVSTQNITVHMSTSQVKNLLPRCSENNSDASVLSAVQTKSKKPKRPNSKTIEDYKRNDQLITMQLLRQITEELQFSLTRKQFQQLHIFMNTQLECLLNKLCSLNKGYEGIFTYRQMEAALRRLDLIDSALGKCSLLIMIAQILTPTQYKHAKGLLIPFEGKRDTLLQSIFQTTL